MGALKSASFGKMKTSTSRHGLSGLGAGMISLVSSDPKNSSWMQSSICEQLLTFSAAFWWSYGFSVGVWSVGSSMVAMGLNAWQCEFRV